jgi:hypothetical protein
MLTQLERPQTYIDPEAPAGSDRVRPRLAPPAFTYRGQGDAHWRGQPCFVADAGAETAAGVRVVLACGCRALVSPQSLQPIRVELTCEEIEVER